MSASDGRETWVCTGPDGRVVEVRERSWYMARIAAAMLLRVGQDEVKAVPKAKVSA
jgi:hypothetical protein